MLRTLCQVLRTSSLTELKDINAVKVPTLYELIACVLGLEVTSKKSSQILFISLIV
jgi:hypothetical protein